MNRMQARCRTARSTAAPAGDHDCSTTLTNCSARWLNGASAWASIGAEMLTNPRYPMGYLGIGPMAASALEVFAHATAAARQAGVRHRRGRRSTARRHAVTEAIVLQQAVRRPAPLHPRRPAADAPKVLIVAPMSGHYATLLRGTVARMVENAARSTSPTGPTRAMVPVKRGPLRSRRLHRLPDRVPRIHRPGHARDRGVPAVGPGVRRDRGDERRPASRAGPPR